MGENENCVDSTRSSAKKRVLERDSLQLSKKRVPLGELTNSVNSTATTELTRKPDRQTHKRKNTLKENVKNNNNNSTTTESSQNLDIGTQKKPKNKVIEEKNDLENSLSTESTQNFELKGCSYSCSIYGYLHSLEIANSRRPLPNYMNELQKDISVNMREILVDWLVEVAEEHKLISDTLYLTISYIDKFLSSKALRGSKLRLLGVSCMLIASKYEESSPPHVEDFCCIKDNTYTKEEVVNMEIDVLENLNYEMSTPTTKKFLRILTKAAQENCESPHLRFEFLSSYLAELSLLEYGCLCFLPSVIAASSVFLSRFTIHPMTHPWTLALQCCSGYGASELRECVLAIHDLQLNRKGSSLRAVRDKYTQHKNLINKVTAST